MEIDENRLYPFEVPQQIQVIAKGHILLGVQYTVAPQMRYASCRFLGTLLFWGIDHVVRRDVGRNFLCIALYEFTCCYGRIRDWVHRSRWIRCRGGTGLEIIRAKFGQIKEKKWRLEGVIPEYNPLRFSCDWVRHTCIAACFAMFVSASMYLMYSVYIAGIFDLGQIVKSSATTCCPVTTHLYVIQPYLR